jgi:predicted Zn finger-like uncharacterized protein
MRIACPDCHATYDVPDALLAKGGKQVRCAKCGTEWFPVAAAPKAVDPKAVDLEAAEPVAAPAPAPKRTAAASAPSAPSHADDDEDDAPRFPLPPTDEPPPSERAPLRAARSPLLGPRRAEIPDEPEEVLLTPGELIAPSRRRRGPLRGWLLSLVVIIAVVSAAVIWRDKVMQAWPPSERAYHAVGLVEVPPPEPATAPAAAAPAPATQDAATPAATPAAPPPAEPAKN